MSAILSACLVLYHCGDELIYALWMFPGVTLLPQKGNIGFGRANNAVLPHLRSKYHLIMNPDVTFDPDLLGRMVSYMENHPGIAILTPRVLNEDGTEQYLPKKRIAVHYLLSGLLEKFGGIFRRWRDEFTMADMEVRHPVPVEFATGCFLLIRTDVFLHLKGFDPRFFLYTRTFRGRMRQTRSIFKYFMKWGVTL